jgi:hypothetical protein
MYGHVQPKTIKSELEDLRLRAIAVNKQIELLNIEAKEIETKIYKLDPNSIKSEVDNKLEDFKIIDGSLKSNEVILNISKRTDPILAILAAARLSGRYNSCRSFIEYIMALWLNKNTDLYPIIEKVTTSEIHELCIVYMLEKEIENIKTLQETSSCIKAYLNNDYLLETEIPSNKISGIRHKNQLNSDKNYRVLRIENIVGLLNRYTDDGLYEKLIIKETKPREYTDTIYKETNVIPELSRKIDSLFVNSKILEYLNINMQDTYIKHVFTTRTINYENWVCLRYEYYRNNGSYYVSFSDKIWKHINYELKDDRLCSSYRYSIVLFKVDH